MHFTGNTRRLFREFCSNYQTVRSPDSIADHRPFVYVSSNEIKLITDVINLGDDGGLFVVSVAEDGIIEVIST